MRLTDDGRRVQAIYDGNVMVYYVDQSRGSHYSDRVWVEGVGYAREWYDEGERLIAEAGGKVPEAMRQRR